MEGLGGDTKKVSLSTSLLNVRDTDFKQRKLLPQLRQSR
jgi:hypothetical protein